MKSRIIVEGGNGQEIGQIVQQNVIGKIRFALESGGQQIGTLNGENWRAWNFNIQDATGREVARITKTWEGLAKTMFTTADNYVVDPRAAAAAAAQPGGRLRPRHRHRAQAGRARPQPVVLAAQLGCVHVHDDQGRDGAGQADVEPAEAGHLVGLGGGDVGRLDAGHVVELEALGQRRGYDVDAGLDVGRSASTPARRRARCTPGLTCRGAARASRRPRPSGTIRPIEPSAVRAAGPAACDGVGQRTGRSCANASSPRARRTDVGLRSVGAIVGSSRAA